MRLLAPKGMRDFLPEEKKRRRKVLDIILDEYKKSGFLEIETSMIEDLDNLTKSNSGENTKLIYKILKRGNKFRPTDMSTEDDLADLGLRFDLTLPLSRYYANNKNDLPTVFRALQTGYVFRAERPGKGRFRAFMQCDVDIIGEASYTAEVELISTIYRTLSRIGLKGQVIKLNDRRLLKALIMSAGFSENDFISVAISLDKVDKIGVEGVVSELESKGYEKSSIDAVIEKLSELSKSGLKAAEALDKESYDNLNSIISVLSSVYTDLKLEFDPSLVRGMGYYTGTIFEVYHESSSGAIGGGGRYDNMIESLSGVSAPACGFSIGYERLLGIVEEMNIIDASENNIALFYSSTDDLSGVIKKADELRNDYDMVTIIPKKKKFGKQLSRLKAEGFDHFAEYAETLEIKES